MAKFKKGERPIPKEETEHYTFRCPGCNDTHVVYVKGFDLSWSFNGDLDNPTISPSLLLWHNGHPEEGIPPYRCHSFIRAGKIQFLNDCTHKLKGQTVPLPELPHA